MSKRLLLLVMVTLLSMFVAVGCGSDGSDGKDGADVDPGTVTSLEERIADLQALLDNLTASDNASQATIDALEAQIAALEAQLEELTGEEAPTAVVDSTDVDVAVAGDNVTLTLASLSAAAATGTSTNVTDLTTFDTVYRAYYYVLEDGLNRNYSIDTDNITVSSASLTIAGIADAVEAAKTTGVRFLVVLNNSKKGTYVNVVANYGDAAVRDIVTNQACMNCHANFIFREGKKTAVDDAGEPKESTRAYHRATVGVEACIVCHENNDPGHSRTNLDLYVHGIHNSHNAPDGDNETITIKNGWNYSVGYPNNMADCVACHTTEGAVDRPAIVTAQKYFTYEVCMSCHVGWDSWDLVGEEVSDLSFHAAYTGAETDLACVECHNGSLAPTFAGFHNGGYEKERYNGKDIAYEIQAITYDPITGDGTVTWRAYNTETDVNFDVLETDSTVGPIFRGDNNALYRGGESYNPQFVFGFARAGEDDWTNEGASAKSGQPSYSVAITPATTTTDINDVATTSFTIPVDARGNFKAIAALQGIPVVGEDFEFAIVSSTTKTFKLDVTAQELPRREIVLNENCQSCHGDFVFHGHYRVNDVQLCVVCHSPNATEKDGRQLLAALNPGMHSDAIDGKTEESYDLKVMIHRIHSAGTYTGPYMLYRSRAIYGFGTGLLEMLGWASPENPVNNGLTGGTIGWNAVEVHYPQPKSNCESCHIPGTYSDAPADAVPVTVAQGTNYVLNTGNPATATSVVAENPYTDANDTVISAARAACTSCHTGLNPSHMKVANLTKSDLGLDNGCSSCHNGSFAFGHGAE